MKTLTTCTLVSALALIAAVSLFAASSASAAPLAAGTQIGIDLGPTLTADWNNITSNDADIDPGSVVDLTGTVVDGVGIGTGNAEFTNDDGTNNWAGLSTNAGSAPAEFVDSVVTDISGNFSLGDGSPYTVIVIGLDPGLTYDIFVVTTANFTPIDTINIEGDVNYGPSAISRPDAQANGLFHSFLGVSAHGSGTLTITSTDTSSGTNPIINGILINAVPEPSSLALLGLGGLLVARRRRS